MTLGADSVQVYKSALCPRAPPNIASPPSPLFRHSVVFVSHSLTRQVFGPRSNRWTPSPCLRQNTTPYRRNEQRLRKIEIERRHGKTYKRGNHTTLRKGKARKQGKRKKRRQRGVRKGCCRPEMSPVSTPPPSLFVPWKNTPPS